MRKRIEPHSPIGVMPFSGYHSSVSCPFFRPAKSMDNSATSESLLRLPRLTMVKFSELTSGGTSLEREKLKIYQILMYVITDEMDFEACFLVMMGLKI
jgi:hypothetical protein